MKEENIDFVPGVGPDEKDKREKSALQTIVTAIVDEQRQSWMQGMKEELDAIRKPVRENMPELVNRTGETVHRLYSPNDYIYRKMSDEDREWRNPDSDHHMAEWIRGRAEGNNARMFQANVALEGMFGRADTALGTAGVSGALATGTGGSLVPRPMEALVIIARDKVATMRRFAQSFMMTAFTHTVPTAAAITSYMTLEGGTTTQGEPTYAAVQITARKGAARAIVTNEMLDDAAVNLVGTMATRAGMSLGALEDAQFWRTGSGTAPNISAFMAGVAYAEDTSGILDFTSLMDAYYTLPQVYRNGASWFAAANVLQALAGVRDANGKGFYQGLVDPIVPITDTPGAMGTIFGRPVYEVDATPGTIHLADVRSLYVIGNRAGLTARVSDHVGFASGTVQFIWEQRFDGQNVDTSAGQTITGITTASSL